MINIKNLSAGYGDKIVLHDISLELAENEFTFILGPNGAGKSTLLKTINGIIAPTHGDITIIEKSFKDYEEKELARAIAFIPQEFHLQFDFTVKEFVLMGRFPWTKQLDTYTKKDVEITEKYLSQLNLVEYNDRYFNQLSGGEKQRILIARALVQETDIILLDESLSFLDINHQIEILKLLKDINEREGKSIIMVSHNLNLAAEFGKRIIFLKNGEVFTSGSPAEVYTKDMLSQIFEMEIAMMENPFTGKMNIVYGG
jgi:iron complex transport system ATP-binding protein